MSELINHKSSVHGKVPSGYFNAMFNFSGSWLNDSADTKKLAFDGYFVSLYYLHLSPPALVLRDKVKKSVPSHWDPAALARFIHKYGTHIIVGMAIGGQDLVCVRQEHSSSMAPADLRANLEDVGDALFSDGFCQSATQRKARDANHMVPEVFNSVLQSNIIQLSSTVDTSRKDVWHYGSALQPCRCLLCRSVVTLLIPAESSQLPQNNPEACRVMRDRNIQSRVWCTFKWSHSEIERSSFSSSTFAE